MEGLSQELVAIIVAAITLAAVMVPGMRSLRREIGDLRREVVDFDRRFTAEVDGLRAKLQAGLGEVRSEIIGLRTDVGEVRSQGGELRQRMARVEGLFEGFTRSEPAFGAGPAG